MNKAPPYQREVNLQAVIGTHDNSVDMKSGLQTLSGISDATRLIAEALINERNVDNLTHQSNIKTKLKSTFKGSYGQNFSIVLNGKDAVNKLRRIGISTFKEIMSYVIAEALYETRLELSDKAHNRIEKIAPIVLKLIDKIRSGPLKSAHEVIEKEGVPVVIREKSKSNQTIALLTEDTAEIIKSRKDNSITEITAFITRFNIKTGNGRLQIIGEDETKAFGFSQKYNDISNSLKNQISKNLDGNNTKDEEKWSSLKIRATTIRKSDKSVIKYLIVGVENAQQ